MKAVIQRVRWASVSSVAAGGDAAAPTVREIGHGLVALAGFEKGDTDEDRHWMAEKIAGLRVFEDEQGKMNRSVVEVGGSVLLVPNFTVAGDARKGRRPSFDHAMEPGLAGPEFERFVEDVRGLVAAAPGMRVERGEFRATMLVTIENDGPVTIILDPRARGREETGVP